MAAHLGEEVEVDAAERELLGALSADEWTDVRTRRRRRRRLKRLLKIGLVIGSGKRHAALRERDEALRAVYWHPLAATLHAFTRWHDADAVQATQDTGTETAGELREVLGPPPAEACRPRDAAHALPCRALPRNDFDPLLARRATCRNFDAERPLP